MGQSPLVSASFKINIEISSRKNFRPPHASKYIFVACRNFSVASKNGVGFGKIHLHSTLHVRYNHDRLAKLPMLVQPYYTANIFHKLFIIPLLHFVPTWQAMTGSSVGSSGLDIRDLRVSKSCQRDIIESQIRIWFCHLSATVSYLRTRGGPTRDIGNATSLLQLNVSLTEPRLLHAS